MRYISVVAQETSILIHKKKNEKKNESNWYSLGFVVAYSLETVAKETRATRQVKQMWRLEDFSILMHLAE